MSFPEGPRKNEQSSLDDSRDAADPAPTDGLIASIVDALRRHTQTWSSRYVEMRVEARTGRQE
ncbi:hypothetical protein [Haloarcula litorea]|uniref:hypothetical protein n=1 Tax=Haloarcula litorea TaxID=3032579 RepID=UPI0023E8AF72|nr:hypothetical protein [Halomicroarcula sp. GDY20]